MKILNSTIAILILVTVSSKTFAQNNFITTSNIDKNKVANTEIKSNTTSASTMKISPMKIAEGTVVIKMLNQAEGNYTVRLTNEEGKVLGTNSFNHISNVNSETIKFGQTLAGGTYTIEIVKPDNSITTETILLLM